LEDKQNNLISSLRDHPLIIVIRLENDFFSDSKKRDKLLIKIKNLSNLGIKNIEIGWDSNPEWINLMSDIKNDFHSINLGAASICSIDALNATSSLNLSYSMSPHFKKGIHLKAIKYNQLLIPGISNIESFKEAIKLGYKIIKIYPVSNLGMRFLDKLKELQRSDIFFIGAGGIGSKDIKNLLDNGYNALVIGKELKNQIPDKDLNIWLKNLKK
tara:strand:- start:72 stop:713 length:642 start_codon:yes stop_codon:yes gene_type:complete